MTLPMMHAPSESMHSFVPIRVQHKEGWVGSYGDSMSTAGGGRLASKTLVRE
jgi:hypothetical protein